MAYNLGNLWRGVPSGPGAAEEDRQLVADQFAATVCEDRRQADQARAVLLAAAGGELSDAAAVRGDSPKDCRLAGGDGVDGGGGCSEMKRPGSEGRRGVHGMQWKRSACRFWFLAAERKWRLVEPKTGSRRKTCNAQDQRMAAGCILNRTPESKMEIPVLLTGSPNCDMLPCNREAKTEISLISWSEPAKGDMR
jgi:hypothetical protein